MKSKFVLVGILVLLVCMLTTAVAGTMAVPFDPTPKTIIMIMLDGFRPDYITMYAPPNLQRLVREGSWVAEARSVFPSMTTANQTSFVTGALPRTTGIPNNSRYDRQLDRIISPLRDNKALTIGEILASNGWRTASVNHFMLQNRGAQQYVNGNMDNVIKLLETSRPGLIVYYNSETDSAGHTYGPFQPGAKQVMLAADAEIGRLLAALGRLGLAEQTTLVVASDHGMSPNDGIAINPDLTKLIVSSGLRITGDNQSIRSDTDLVYIASGSLFLYWRNGRKTPEREAMLMRALANVEGADVYTAADLAKLGADAERVGDVVIAPHPGRSLTRGGGTGGGHGTLGEMHSTMLFWGTGVKAGTVIHQASITDIVPTLLTLAKADIPSSVDGSPLNSILIRTSWKSRLAKAGSYQVRDVAASDMSFTDLPAYIADANLSTYWEVPIGAANTVSPYVTLDYGTDVAVSSVEVVSADGEAPVGPKECSLEVSSDGMRYTTVFSGEISAIVGGQSTRIDLKQATKARYLRLSVVSGWDLDKVQVAELRAWAGGSVK